jgi:hypothetical protein
MADTINVPRMMICSFVTRVTAVVLQQNSQILRNDPQSVPARHQSSQSKKIIIIIKSSQNKKLIKYLPV